MLIFAPMLGSRNKSATWKIKKGVNCYFVILALPSNLPWAQITLDKKGKTEEKSAQYVSTCNSPVQNLEGEWLQAWAQ